MPDAAPARIGYALSQCATSAWPAHASRPTKSPAPGAGQSVEIRGTAELTGDPGKSLPRALSRKYLGEDPPPEPDELARVIVRVIPERVNAFSA